MSISGEFLPFKISDVDPTYNGLIAMSYEPKNYMAFPSSTVGEVNVVNIRTSQVGLTATGSLNNTICSSNV